MTMESGDEQCFNFPAKKSINFQSKTLHFTIEVYLKKSLVLRLDLFVSSDNVHGVFIKNLSTLVISIVVPAKYSFLCFRY